MKKLLLLLLLPLIFTFSVNAQTTTVNVNEKVCISRESANQIPIVLAERNALREQVTILKEVKENDRSTVNDLKLKLAVETQRSIDKEAELVRMTAIIEFLLKNGRVKKVGLINIF